MRLHFESVGAGFPILILHGLFGSSDNWAGFAGNLKEKYRVLLPDLRNHGRSAHSSEMSYTAMAEDLVEHMDREEIAEAHVMGHSMGGKTAMQLALNHPDRVRSLIAVDIAPRAYQPRHNRILSALLGLSPSEFGSRQEMEIALEPAIPDLQVRRFLLKGVARDASGRFYWRMGINEIADNYDNVSDAISFRGVFERPSLFVRGELSDYVSPEDEVEIRKAFPAARFACVPRASHWVHVDNPGGFLEAVETFLGAGTSSFSRGRN